MSLTIPNNLSMLKPKLGVSQVTPTKPRSMIVCSASQTPSTEGKSSPPLQAFSAALALSSILLSAPLPAVADISGLTPLGRVYYTGGFVVIHCWMDWMGW
ncbi:hypothetical protein H0E87_006440 [Populus deltoides]|uniref:Uncharacterized protein n=1 Tax=Populus deltoides TaxID=3696 RepID=A0A8T2Z6W3_POPDE|nr:hypothetical protein H0E87_006440 [Populus deltoides]